MAKFTVKQSGGARLRRFIDTRVSLLAKLERLDIRVGFEGGYIVGLALSHEFGVRAPDGSVSIPERPAFRAGLRKVRKSWSKRCKAIMRKASNPKASESEVLAMVADAVREQRDIIRESYLNFHGTPLSERQRERKAGTPYETKELIGAEGPKLPKHIRGWVNGVEV